MPTVDDVAHVAGVSRQTVSNVLNSPTIVREGTRDRVLAAIDQLGYRPHASARRLRTRKSSTIGVRIDPWRDGISGAVLDRFLHKLTEHADARGLRVMVFSAADPADEIHHVRRLREGSDVDAFVLTATVHGDERIAWLTEHGVPFVAFGRPWDPEIAAIPHRWVDVDGRAGVASAVTHLREQGAKRVAWIGWPRGSGTGDERRAGWVEACGLDDEARVRYSCHTTDGVTEGTRCAAQLLALSAPPDAIACASDSLGLGAVMAAQNAGRPELPVIGFDDTPVAAAVGLSSVEQPLDDVVAAALELLFGAEGDDVRPNPVARVGGLETRPAPPGAPRPTEGTNSPVPERAQRDEGPPPQGLETRPASPGAPRPTEAKHDEEPANHRLLAPRLVERRPGHLALDATPGP